MPRLMTSETRAAALGAVTALLIPARAAAACEEAAPLVGATERAVVSGRLGDVPELVAATEAAFACGPPAPRDLLGRWYRVQAAWFSLSDAPEEARLAWRSAALASPGSWTDALGPALHAEQVRALETTGSGNGTVALVPPPDTHQTLLDGLHVPFPVSTPPGLHLVQVIDPGSGTAVFARQVFLLEAGERFELDTGPLPGGSPAPTGATPPPMADSAPVERLAPGSPDRATRTRWPLWAGLGAGALAGTAAALARAQSAAMQAATDAESLDTAWGRQRALGFTAYGLAGVAVVGVSVGLAL